MSFPTWVFGPGASCAIRKVWFRKLQCLDYLWKHYGSSAAFDKEIFDALWKKFTDVPCFVAAFTSDEFWKKDPSKTLNGQKGICHWTAPKFQEFLQNLPTKSAQALAELVYGMFTTEFDMQVLAHVTENPDGGASDYDSLALLMRGSGEETPLSQAFKKYLSSLAGQATTIIDDGPAIGGAHDPLAATFASTFSAFANAEDGEENEEDQQEKQLLFDKIVADKANKVRFHGLPHVSAGPLVNFESKTELNKVLVNCPFHSQSGGALGPKEKTKSKAWLLSADLFPACMGAGGTDYRLPSNKFIETEVPDSLKSLWDWVKSIRKPEDSIVVFDGRFAQVRRYFDAELAALGAKFVLEFWIIYETPQDDPRYTKRKVAFANPNREVILVYRPVLKRKNTTIARQAFNACGETSSFDMTYSAVQLRSLGELPKLTPADKRKMMGTELDIPLAYVDAPQGLAADGVPFAWGETKPVAWWASFFKDLQIDSVFDTTAGSAAAAIGAHYQGVQYDGLCCNPLHKKWCEDIMNKAMFAIIADGGAGATDEHIKKVKHFFGPFVDEGMRLLKAQGPKTEKKAADEDEEENEDEEEEEDDDEEEEEGEDLGW
jgi:hypothetical protein